MDENLLRVSADIIAMALVAVPLILVAILIKVIGDE